MVKRLWCVLLTAVMLLNLLPVGLADNEGLEEPIPATVELQSEVQEEAQQEIIEEPLPPEETLPEEEAAEEPIPYEAEPQPEEEAMEEPSPSPVETELADEADGTLDILTIPEEEQPDDELPDMLMAAAKPEDEEIVEEEEEDEDGEPVPLTEVELAALGININEKVYEITPGRRCISAGTWTIKKNVNNWRRAYIDGDVTIILPDNLTLTFDFGLQMRSAKTLTITTPENSQHNGRLVAHGYEKRPGIGGWNKSLGTGFLTINSGIIIADGGVDGAGLDPEVLTVNGGTVEAKGSPNCAGIGGNNGNFGVHRIIINNGHVTARGGVNAAGIGGGNGWGGCTVIINGGVVEAYGGENAAGIGGGKGANAFYNPYYDSLTITGGTVTATGGTNGAGIGGGDGGQCGDAKYLNTGVNIAGGNVTANGGQGAAGIGGGRGGRNGSIAITGGTVTANGGQGAAGIGGGDGGSGGSVAISSCTVTAVGGIYGAGIGSGNGASGGTVTIHSGKVTAIGGKNAAGIGGGYHGHCDSIIIEDGDVEAQSGTFDIVGTTLPGTEGGAGIGTGSSGSGGEVVIRDGTVTANGGAGAAGIGGGWHGYSHRVTLDGGTVKAIGGANGAGIGSGDQAYTFTVFINNGDVEAHGGTNAAGIGRGGGANNKRADMRGGDVIIDGGTVKAIGGYLGAGIGGADNDRVSIRAGQVTAQGGNDGAGIGGSQGCTGGNISISGGIVNATGIYDGAGIGGAAGSGGSITITGGTVNAEGGWWSAGIGGGGRWSYGGTVIITGGTVTAHAKDYGAGIGGGNDGNGGNVRIDGGIVTATADAYGSGIGGGGAGSGGYVAINGGIVTAIGGWAARGIGKGSNGPSFGTLLLKTGLNVINISNDEMQTQILAPTAPKLNGVRKVLIGNFVPEPMAAALPYNGSQQSGYLNPGQPTRVEGTTAAKELGDYTFTVTPGTGYTWTDGTNAAKTLPWAIVRAKVTVKANDRTITYGDREPELTATVRGTAGRDRVNYQISRDAGKDIGAYIIMPSGEAIQGNYEVAYESGTLTIRPKNVSAIRESDFQTIAAGTGDFTEPTFRDRALDEDIPGTLTYAYNRRRMTEEELRKALAALPAGARGTITWSYEAEGNFVGTITGRIDFIISGIEFTVDSRTADASNAVTIKNNPTYGDTWEEIVTISDRIVVSVGRETGRGTYTLNVSGTPNAGKQTYSVLFNGSVNRVTYTNVTVLTGEVDIARADYKDVNKTASGEIEPEVGRSVIIPLPEIPQGASYGTPRKAVESDPYTLFGISGNQIAVALTDIPETNPMTFTVPVNPDGNHNGYDITVTLTVRSGAHTHFFRYTASGHQITAVCRAANCPLPESRVTLTLNAPANLTYDGNAKEVTFADGEAETWKEAAGSDAPVITYTADRGSALTGGKPVNAGSYTASINVYGQRARARFTVAKADYADVTKEASADLNAARNSRVSVTLPAIPNGTRYGTPVKANRNDPYSLSGISANRITVTSSGIPQDVNAVSFTVPVIPDANHNGYTVTVTVNVIQPKITVSAKVSRGYLRTGLLLLRRVPTYTATITAGYTEPSAQPLRVAYSLTGYYYTPGSQFTSLLPIQRFYIRVTDPNGVHYYYRYENGRTVPR